MNGTEPRNIAFNGISGASPLNDVEVQPHRWRNEGLRLFLRSGCWRRKTRLCPSSFKMGGKTNGPCPINKTRMESDYAKSVVCGENKIIVNKNEMDWISRDGNALTGSAGLAATAPFYAGDPGLESKR